MTSIERQRAKRLPLIRGRLTIVVLLASVYLPCVSANAYLRTPSTEHRAMRKLDMVKGVVRKQQRKLHPKKKHSGGGSSSGYMGCLALSTDELTTYESFGTKDCSYVAHSGGGNDGGGGDDDNAGGGGGGDDDNEGGGEGDGGDTNEDNRNGDSTEGNDQGDDTESSNIVVDSNNACLSDDDDGSCEYDPYTDFDISQCDTYSNLWTYDLAMTCTDSDNLQDCQCLFTEELMDLGLLSCDGGVTCPYGCAICNSCLQLAGCDTVYTAEQDGTNSSSALAYAIGGALGLLVVGTIFYASKKRRLIFGLGDHLIEDGAFAGDVTGDPMKPRVWLAPADQNDANYAPRFFRGVSSTPANNSIIVTPLPNIGTGEDATVSDNDSDTQISEEEDSSIDEPEMLLLPNEAEDLPLDPENNTGNALSLETIVPDTQVSEQRERNFPEEDHQVLLIRNDAEDAVLELEINTLYVIPPEIVAPELAVSNDNSDALISGKEDSSAIEKQVWLNPNDAGDAALHLEHNFGRVVPAVTIAPQTQVSEQGERDGSDKEPQAVSVPNEAEDTVLELETNTLCIIPPEIVAPVLAVSDDDSSTQISEEKVWLVPNDADDVLDSQKIAGDIAIGETLAPVIDSKVSPLPVVAAAASSDIDTESNTTNQ